MNKKGFTLIELLIVVAIIGLLATLAILSLTTAQSKARDTKRIADVKSLQNGIEMFYNDSASYPEPAAPTWASFQTTMATYITALPADPTSTVSYTVVIDSTNGYCIMADLENNNTTALAQDDDDNYCKSTLSGAGFPTATAPAATATLVNSLSGATPPDVTTDQPCADANYYYCIGN